MASVRRAVGAKEDLRDILSFVSRHSEAYGATLAGRIVAAVDRLETDPMFGRMVPEYGDETVREIIVGNYRIVYQFEDLAVGIVAIVHGSRDLIQRLGREPWDLG